MKFTAVTAFSSKLCLWMASVLLVTAVGCSTVEKQPVFAIDAVSREPLAQATIHQRQFTAPDMLFGGGKGRLADYGPTEANGLATLCVDHQFGGQILMLSRPGYEEASVDISYKARKVWVYDTPSHARAGICAQLHFDPPTPIIVPMVKVAPSSTSPAP